MKINDLDVISMIILELLQLILRRAKFNQYVQDSHITSRIIDDNITVVELISRPVDFLVNESEIMGMLLDLLINYFNENGLQRDVWRIRQQKREEISNKVPDFIVYGKVLQKWIAKLGIEAKTFDGDNFDKMIEQISISTMYTIGDRGEYTNEFNTNSREILFTGSSQFVILCRGTKVAFLERYSYDLDDLGVQGKGCMVPLTMPVNKRLGIENPRLVEIMNRHRHLCDGGIAFQYDRPLANNLGKYYVFDLILHPDACHELFQYVSSELPRLHVLD